MTASIKKAECAFSGLTPIFRWGIVMAAWRLATLAVAIPLLAVCGIWGSLIMIRMVEEINRMRPTTEQILEMGYYPRKNLMIWKEHRRLYPKGRLRAHFMMLFASGIICLLLAAYALSFF